MYIEDVYNLLEKLCLTLCDRYGFIYIPNKLKTRFNFILQNPIEPKKSFKIKFIYDKKTWIWPSSSEFLVIAIEEKEYLYYSIDRIINQENEFCEEFYFDNKLWETTLDTIYPNLVRQAKINKIKQIIENDQI